MEETYDVKLTKKELIVVWHLLNVSVRSQREIDSVINNSYGWEYSEVGCVNKHDLWNKLDNLCLDNSINPRTDYKDDTVTITCDGKTVKISKKSAKALNLI